MSRWGEATALWNRHDFRRADRLTNLYHAALTRPPEVRSAFLKDACDGDETRRQEVESLLRYESDHAPFLETPAMLVGSDPTRSPDSSPMIGRQLGPYSILAPLGSGVRARDSKLGRDVAIKILPSHFTADPERRARFAREARLLAPLNARRGADPLRSRGSRNVWSNSRCLATANTSRSSRI